MNRFKTGASWAAIMVCLVGAGAACGQNFKPVEYKYTPSPADSPWGGPPGESADDYYRRETGYVQNWDRIQNQQAQEKLDREMPWWKSVNDFRAPSTEQLTTGAAVLFFTVMGGILLWVGAGSMFRRSSAPTDAPKGL